MNSATEGPIATAEEGKGQTARRRYRRIAAAGVSALAGKGTSLLVNALTVPITVRYLGAESYGLWITISSVITMFFVMDLGISSTLTNLISQSYANDDRERAAEYFSTAFWILSAIAACLGIAGALAWPHVPWGALFNIKDAPLAHETSQAAAAAFVVFLFALPMALVSKVLAGYQELHAANLFATAGSVLSLLMVVAVVLMHGGLAVLVGAYAGSTVAANGACMAWMCVYRKPWMKPSLRRFRWGLIKPIFHSGTQFFAIQVAGLVVFSSDNLIISHYLSPARVTPYAVTWRLVNYIAAAQTLIFPALWPAYSEAYASGHLDWIRATYRHVRWITIVVLAVGCSVAALAGRSIIRIWAGPAAVPAPPLIELMCVWIVIYAFSTNQSCLMGATTRVGKQAISSVTAAVFNLALSIFWVRTMGPFGVLFATIVSYLVFIVAVQTLEVRRILRGDFLPT
ncbi:MAG TPA: MATE family efflux transporter [Terracidiphilus sp.]|nr:MATE family efflux transporter [Terracidiphilus sp.]